MHVVADVGFGCHANFLLQLCLFPSLLSCAAYFILLPRRPSMRLPNWLVSNGDLARYQDPSFLLVSPSAIVHGQKAGRRGGLRHHGGGMVQVRQRAHHLAQTIRAAAVVLPPLGGEHVRSGGDAAGGGGQNSVGAVQRGDRHSFAGEGRAATGHRRLHPARTGGGGSTGARRCAPDRRRGCPGLITQIAAHSKSRRRTRQDSCTYAGMF